MPRSHRIDRMVGQGAGDGDVVGIAGADSRVGHNGVPPEVAVTPVCWLQTLTAAARAAACAGIRACIEELQVGRGAPECGQGDGPRGGADGDGAGRIAHRTWWTSAFRRCRSPWPTRALVPYTTKSLAQLGPANRSKLYLAGYMPSGPLPPLPLPSTLLQSRWTNPSHAALGSGSAVAMASPAIAGGQATALAGAAHRRSKRHFGFDTAQHACDVARIAVAPLHLGSATGGASNSSGSIGLPEITERLLQSWIAGNRGIRLGGFLPLTACAWTAPTLMTPASRTPAFLY